jgi:uncharacterized phiE125 gp8 family phage protein
MGLVRTVDPTVDAVTVSEAKAQVGIAAAVTAYDSQIATMLAACIEWFEQETRRAFITQTWQMTLSAFPLGDEPIILPRPPLISVTSVAYVDADGASQTLGASSYLVRTKSNPGGIWLAYNGSWPTTHPEEPEAVTVTYVAGYGATMDSLPVLARHGVLLLFDHWWRNRGGGATNILIAVGIPPAVTSIAKRLHCGMKFGAYGVTA